MPDRKGAATVSELIAKKLAALQAGIQLSLTYPAGPGTYETAAGTVAENNFTDGIALLTPEGDEVLLDYRAVCALKIPKAAVPAAVPVSAGAPESVPARFAAALRRACRPGGGSGGGQRS